MLFCTFRSLFLGVSVATSVRNVDAYVAVTSYAGNAEAALTTLMKWYNNDTGIWNTTGWWNSANAMTMLGNFAAVHDNTKTMANYVFSNSIDQAQNYNLNGMKKLVLADYNIETIWNTTSPPVTSINPKGFLNGYYDDEGWWALGWIQAFDVTGNQDYPTEAIDIFEDMKNGSEPNCGGGIWWDKDKTYVNAIANELYLSVGAHLANRVPDQKDYYTNITTTQWEWFQNSGMINAQNNINDGLDSKTCKNNNGTVWSYNQGVIIGALVEMDKANPNTTYIDKAKSIAFAAIKKLSDVNGVLHDPCEPNCGSDGSQFKGIFMRNLQFLQSAAPNDAFLAFIASNANSIWKNDRDGQNELSVDWAGPFVQTANASTQSSAMDALIAALAFQGQLGNGIAS